LLLLLLLLCCLLLSCCCCCCFPSNLSTRTRRGASGLLTGTELLLRATG
jgi:hypothetical protein